jgi:hypothetical protein
MVERDGLCARLQATVQRMALRVGRLRAGFW